MIGFAVVEICHEAVSCCLCEHLIFLARVQLAYTLLL